MAISEATALARARQVRATFPTGTITIAQAKAMVMAMADSQVGYASGSPVRSLYGDGNNWRSVKGWHWDGYWCARGISWVFEQCFGADAATAGIGKQTYTPLPAGWAATWLWLAWLRKGRWVGLENAQPGDISIQSWGRTGRESDHVEIVTGTWNGSTYPCIGFNTVAGAGPVTTGATVAKVRRHRAPTVGIYRPDWAALVAAYNAQVVAEEVIDLTRVAASLIDLGYPATQAGVRAYQSDKDTWGHNLAVDGIPGPATERALGESMAKIDDILSTVKQIHARQSNLDAGHNNIVRRLTEAIEKVPAAVWAHRNPAHSGNRDAHGLLRDAATAKTHARNAGVLSAAQIADKPEQEES